MEEIVKRYNELVDFLNKCDYYYYVLDNPIISDAEYDELKKELFEIEKKYPQIIRPDSPSQRLALSLQRNSKKLSIKKECYLLTMQKVKRKFQNGLKK